MTTPQTRVCCYPWDAGFIEAVVARIDEAFVRRELGIHYRLLLSLNSTTASFTASP